MPGNMSERHAAKETGGTRSKGVNIRPGEAGSTGKGPGQMTGISPSFLRKKGRKGAGDLHEFEKHAR